MKILALNYEYPPIGGGGGVGLKQYAESWARNGHEVTVLSSSENCFYHREAINGVTVHRVPVFPPQASNVTPFLTMFTYMVSAIFIGWCLLVRRDFDVINTHFAIPTGPAGSFLQTVGRLPNVQTIIGGDIYDPSKAMSPHRHWWLRVIVRTVCSTATKVVSISTDTARRAERYFDVKGVSVIPYGFDPPEIVWPDPGDLGYEAGRYHLVSIGRLVPRKGYDVLLQALAELNDPEVRLHFIGDGPQREDLQSLAVEFGLEDRVVFEGDVRGDEKFHRLHAADAYVLSSLHEGLGIVIQEAMFCGLPIVSTDNGGQTDLLDDGDNALLVPPGDPQALADAIETLKDDPDLAKTIGEANREKIKDYGIDAMSERYLETFRSLLA